MKITKSNLNNMRPRLLYAERSTHIGDDAKRIDNAELILVCKGKGSIEINGSVYEINEKELVIFNSGCEYKATSETSEYDIIKVGFDNFTIRGQATCTILKNDDYCILNADKEFTTLEFIMSRLIAETERKVPADDNISDNLIKLLLLYAVRLISADGTVSFKDSCLFSQARNYLDEHFTEIENLDDVCNALNVDKFYISHLFTRKINTPPLKYITKKRIELACEYLETTDDNVSDIGRMCGYSEPAYFSRMFKKVKGVTPLNYRYLFKLDKADKEKEEKVR